MTATCWSMTAKSMTATNYDGHMSVHDGHNKCQWWPKRRLWRPHVMSVTACGIIIYWFVAAMDLPVMVYLVAIIDVAFIICGCHGLAVTVYLVAVMEMFCGHHGIGPYDWLSDVEGIWREKCHDNSKKFIFWIYGLTCGNIGNIPRLNVV